MCRLHEKPFSFFFSNKKILNCITKLQTKVFVTQSFDGFISSPLLIVIIIIINIHDYRSRQPDIFVYKSLEAIRNGGFPIQFRFMNYFFSWVRKIISKNRILNQSQQNIQRENKQGLPSSGTPKLNVVVVVACPLFLCDFRWKSKKRERNC